MRFVFRLLLASVKYLALSIVAVFIGFFLYMSFTLPSVNSALEISPNDCALVAVEEKVRFESLHPFLWQALEASGEGKYAARLLAQESLEKAYGTTGPSIERVFKQLAQELRIRAFADTNRVIEASFSKFYFGKDKRGIACASQALFEKLPSEVSLSEAALLVALLKSPSYYEPTRNPQKAKKRRDLIIGKMLERGFVTPQEAETAMASPLLPQLKAGMKTP